MTREELVLNFKHFTATKTDVNVCDEPVFERVVISDNNNSWYIIVNTTNYRVVSNVELITYTYSETLFHVMCVVDGLRDKMKRNQYIVQFVEYVTKEIGVESRSVYDARLDAEDILSTGIVVKTEIEPKEHWVVKVGK